MPFEWRVLEEAQDETNPLLERFKFLSIVGSNLEEFFMVRVAGLKRQLESGITCVAPDGFTALEQLQSIRLEVSKLFAACHQLFKRTLLPALNGAGIRILGYNELDKEQKARMQDYFLHNIFPVLTPLGFDPGHPFPHISNLSFNLAVLIRDRKKEERFARIKIPDTLPQLISVDSQEPGNKWQVNTGSVIKPQTLIWLDEIMSGNLNVLFPGMKILEVHPFFVTRDAELEVQEWEAEDLLETTEEGIRQRRFGDVVKLTIQQEMPKPILDILVSNLEDCDA